MKKAFITLLTEFVEDNGRKILENPDRFKSLFLDFSQNQFKAEVQIFCQFLASPQAQEIKQSDDVDTLFLNGVAERFHQAYLFDKNTCELIVKAFAMSMGLIDKKVFATEVTRETVKPKAVKEKIEKKEDKPVSKIVKKPTEEKPKEQKTKQPAEDKPISKKQKEVLVKEELPVKSKPHDDKNINRDFPHLKQNNVNFSKKNKKIILIGVAIIAVIGFSIFGINKNIEIQQQRIAIEAQRQREAEIQRQRDAEAQRQRELETQRQRELEIRRQIEAAGFVFIQGGTFYMGSHLYIVARDSDETPRHVSISSFYIGRYPVTQREYQDIIGTNPSYFKGDNLPVEQVSWFDAIEYCNRRSQKEGLTPVYSISGSGNNRSVTWNHVANGYRLPTSAEWEYACRAGTNTPFNTGNNITTSQANFNNSVGRTTPVGSYAPNAWGLYDMHGNIYEWNWDFLDDGYRINRGGCWSNRSQFLRTVSWTYANPSRISSACGFRVARNVN
ncbi:MAG: SUMF1/EgtB/PvdO family nonheme iron enzyme [Treponema sp.]|nr:SUMF1/EgtB/PvdO family nonheme iron enzyme [Treponema sp.]